MIIWTLEEVNMKMKNQEKLMNTVKRRRLLNQKIRRKKSRTLKDRCDLNEIELFYHIQWCKINFAISFVAGQKAEVAKFILCDCIIGHRMTIIKGR